MSYTSYSQHRYKVAKVNPENGLEIMSTEVIGSRAAFSAQLNLEEQGFHVAVFNVTKGVEEYRTGEDRE